ncbi:hypothetical protein F383_23653 [Gossypium arboreum]|uniref:Uncharacterized protein n=1 Tax=Gossypium arboreum TaxID=29729 RepID=A0A0B0NZ90_GOSAR|nr:hypothetical protein F383_23653 [Gossypium arboreum]
MYFITETSSQANIHLEIVYMSYQYIMCKHIFLWIHHGRIHQNTIPLQFGHG